MLNSLVPLTPPTNGWGGPVTCIAVHPGNASEMFIGTAGGLYRTADGGSTWTRVEGFPSPLVEAASYCPSDPSILVCTAAYDTRTRRAGGIFRSADGGVTWDVPSSSVPPVTPRTPERIDGFGISWVPGGRTVWVATDAGLMRSDDRGQTWVRVAVDPNATGRNDGRGERFTPDRMFSVVAIDADHVVAGGDGGYYYMYDGVTWNRSAGAAPNVFGPRGLAVAPNNSRLLFRADFGTRFLQMSIDQGISWVDFPGLLLASNAGPFVRTTSSPRGPRYFELYFGDGTFLRRITLAADDTPSWAATPWEMLTLDHRDPLDIAFHPVTLRPLLVSADSGVMKTRDDGRTWSSVGSGPAGLNAHLVLGLGVQDVARPRPQTRVMFITWHNLTWYSSNAGRSWVSRDNIARPGSRASGAEGVEIRVSGPELDEEPDALVSLQPGLGPAELYNPGIDGFAPNFPPRQASCFRHVVFYRHPGDRRPYVVTATYDCGGARVIYDQRDVRAASWEEIARGDFAPYGLPQVAVRGDTASLYHVSIDPTTNRRRLTKLGNLNRSGGAAPSMTTPAMRGFGSIGVSRERGPAPVFGVQPDDDRVIIAADELSSRMMRSTTGGDDWHPLDQLTALMTDGGRLRFRTPQGLDQPTKVAFDPYRPGTVAVGTMQAGLLLSFDGGDTWERVPQSESVTHILDVGFAKDGRIYVGSYGRTVWAMEFLIFRPIVVFYDWLNTLIRDPMTGALVPLECVSNPDCCPACFHVIAQRGWLEDVEFDQDKKTFTVYATEPDAIAVQGANQDGVSLRIASAIGEGDARKWPAWSDAVKQGKRAKALVLSEQGVVGYAAAGQEKEEVPDKVLMAEPPAPRQPTPALALKGITDTAPTYDIALVGSSLTVSGVGFVPTDGDPDAASPVTVSVNGHVLAADVKVGADSGFAVDVELRTAPAQTTVMAAQATPGGSRVAERKLLVLNHDGAEELMG